MLAVVLRLTLVVAVGASYPVFAEPGDGNALCERVVGNMLRASTWRDIYTHSAAVPERCIDGYFAEEMSDVFVIRLREDWDGFMTVVSDNPDNTWFFGMVVKRINATLDRKDVAFLDHFAKTHCLQTLQAQCDQVRKRIRQTLDEIDGYKK